MDAMDGAKENIQAVDDILVHYGIKGMKWGVRKERISNPELKKQAVKIYNKKTDPLVEVRLNQIFDISPLTISDYHKMSTRTPVIPKDKNLYRTIPIQSKNKNLVSHMYVTSNKRDAEVYRGLIPTLRAFEPLRKSDYKPHEEIVFKTTKILRGPSEKERVDLLAELMSKPGTVQGKLGSIKVGKPMSLRESFRRTKIISRSEYKKSTDLELALKLHRRVHQNMGIQSDPIGQAYLKHVREKGYDMVSDDWDSGIISKNPTIILNPKKSTRVDTVTRLSNDDILNAQIKLQFAYNGRR